jgi:hypothetical protein
MSFLSPEIPAKKHLIYSSIQDICPCLALDFDESLVVCQLIARVVSNRKRGPEPNNVVCQISAGGSISKLLKLQKIKMPRAQMLALQLMLIKLWLLFGQLQLLGKNDKVQPCLT